MLRRRVDEQAAFLFIDIGSGGTTAVVTRGLEILLIKPLPVGGQTMDRLVARKLKLSLEDAAQARRKEAEAVAARAEVEKVNAELETTLAPAAAAAARSYLELLEQADELCRDGTLLTPAPSAAVRRLRRWFVEEMAAQLPDGATPSPPR